MNITLQFDSIDELEAWSKRLRFVAPVTVDVPPPGSSIDDLELIVRANNILKDHNITTIEQLCGYREWELLRLPGMGRHTMNDIKKALERHGLSFRKMTP